MWAFLCLSAIVQGAVFALLRYHGGSPSMQNCYRSFEVSGWERVPRSAATPPPKLRGISPHAPPQNRRITASCAAPSGHNSRMVGSLQPPRRAAADTYQVHDQPVLLSASTPHDLPCRASCRPQASAPAARSPRPRARSSCSMRRLCGEVACWFGARLRVPLADARAQGEDGRSERHLHHPVLCIPRDRTPRCCARLPFFS